MDTEKYAPKAQRPPPENFYKVHAVCGESQICHTLSIANKESEYRLLGFFVIIPTDSRTVRKEIERIIARKVCNNQ
ncbi:MAG: hypothetical protein KDE54_18150 [Caldilineaceae bacterium]|nr:hypothetical protein [Caldilineaceae bacterium]MCB0143972.1 hypothetical protein [Caldilineaceae bacterium]MCB9157860.1 hypothetical protein [Caldilineaceae bacterium]